MSATYRNRGWILRTLAIATVGVGGFAPEVFGSNFVWTGGSTNGPFWNDPENWNVSAIPGAGDAATVASTAQPELGTNQSVATLTLSNCTITGIHLGADELTAISGLNLTGGTGTMTISQYTLINQGNGTWNGGTVQSAGPAAFVNSGTLTLLSNDTFIEAFAPAATLQNSGLLIKSAGTGTSQFQVELQNQSTGIIEADSGTLQFTNGGTLSNSAGTFFANGGVVRLDQQTIASGAIFRGGTNILGIENTLLGGTVSSGTLQIVDSANQLDGSFAVNSTGQLELTGSGQLLGNGSIVSFSDVPGTFLWTGGTMRGGDSPSVITCYIPMHITGDAIKRLDTGHFINAGNSTWDGSGAIFTFSAPTFGNSGTLNLQSDAGIVEFSAPAALLNNSGTFKKTAGTGTSLIQADLQNTGTIEADSGVLYFQGFTSLSFSSGKFVSNGGIVRLESQILNTGASFGGTGTSQIDLVNVIAGSISIGAGTTQVVGSSNTLSGSINIASGATFEMAAGGELGGNGGIQGPGTFLFSGGMLDGASVAGHALTSTAPMLIDGAGIKKLNAGTFTNAGNAVWNNGDIQTSTNPTWNNTGTLDLRSDNALFSGSGLPMTFNNSGTLKKTAGTGTSDFSAVVNNTGTISINSGTLEFDQNFSTTGTFTVAASAHTAFNGASTTLGGVQNWPAGYVLTQTQATILNSDAGHAGANLDLEQISGSLTINSTQHLAALTVRSTQATISAGGNKLVATKSLNVTAFSTLDVADNAIVIDYDGDSPLPTLSAQIASAYHGGAWDGTDGFASTITSSSAAAASGSAHPTALGYAEASALGISSFEGEPADSSTAIIRYTFSGDANLDGRVNALDFNALATNFGGSGSEVWDQGDFNYDGSVNTSDFTMMAQNFGQVLSSPALGVVVPEPSIAALTALLTCTPRRGRRKR
jgi:hypothetical protein